MAIITNTVNTVVTKGQFRDEEDKIYDISPTDTPVIAGLDRTKVEGIKHIWQTDALKTVDLTASIEGDVFNPTARVYSAQEENVCQITRDDFNISNTDEAVRKYGRDSEITYQKMKSNKFLRNKQEHIICNNQAAVNVSSDTARQLRGLPSWLKTNVSTDGANAVTTSARVDGSARPYNESHLLAVRQLAWENGADTNSLIHFSGSFNKRALTGFVGANGSYTGQTRFDKSEDKKLTNTIQVYEDDFGTMTCQMSRFMRTRDVLLLDPNFAALGELRPMRTVEQGVNGDAEGFMLVTEYTLVVRNEKAHAGVFDLTSS